MMVKYELKDNEILKDGHTMFLEDVVKDLNRKALLEHEKAGREIDIDTTFYREKYAKRKHGNNMAYPAGGADVNRLCDAIERVRK